MNAHVYGLSALGAIGCASSAVGWGAAASAHPSGSFETCVASAAPTDAAKWTAMREFALQSAAVHTEALKQAKGYFDGIASVGAPTCFDALEEDARILTTMHCADGGDPVDDAACLALAELEISTRLGCHSFAVDIDDPYRVHREVAEEDFSMWTRLGEPRARRGRRLPGNSADLFADIVDAYRHGHDDAGIQRALTTARRSGVSGPAFDRAIRAVQR
jgi:hypothetical protein